jgi:hypothetical protein
MAITSIKTGSSFTNLKKYNDFLAGNAPFNPADYESIATTTVGAGGSATITFSSIPSTYQHLQIRALTRGSQAGAANLWSVRFNSDTGNNYYGTHLVYGNGSSAGVFVTSQADLMYWADLVGSSTSANIFATSVTDILDYANTNKNKTVRTLYGWDANGSGVIALASSLWMSTSAVNSITIFPQSGNFSQYSSLALYGIKG